MFITAKLVFESYVPDELLKGMWFKQKIKDVVYGKIYQYDRIFELNHIPDYEEYVAANGYPVKPVIMSYTANPDEPAVILAHPEQIGWWDEDPSSDTMRDIELRDFNVLLEYYDGDIEIEVEYHEDKFGEEFVASVIYMDKVTLSVPGLHAEYDYYINEENEEEDDDDYDEDTPPDDYENMDWEDDEPEEDSAGFTENDRQPRSHFVTNEEADFDALMEREYKKHKHSGDDTCIKHDADHDTE